MLLTVPCCPLPCFLIGLKTVLPLKRRVSGLFLWLRCVSLWSSVPTECCPVPTCPHWGPCMMCCTLSLPSSSFCLQGLLAFPLPQFSSPFLFDLCSGESGHWSVLWVVTVLRPHWEEYSTSLCTLLSWGLLLMKPPPELHSLFFFCAPWASRAHLFCLKVNVWSTTHILYWWSFLMSYKDIFK